MKIKQKKRKVKIIFQEVAPKTNLLLEHSLHSAYSMDMKIQFRFFVLEIRDGKRYM